ncbi:MAG: DNA replication/repair protein RecF [Peptococcaceae bacterium]|nr:DNA replication/repair protein RecF [Peptococcaceae bacterium]
MYLTRLEARDFRNYRHIDLRPHPGLNIICGANAQGKTNFLEAICTVLRGFSFRTSRGADMIRWQARQAVVKGEVATATGSNLLEIMIDPQGKKVAVGGQPVAKHALARFLGVVVFTPEDLWLIKGGPGERRRFIDLELGFLSPDYWNLVRDFRRALSQRNSLLKNGQTRGDLFDLWTRQFCDYAGRLLAYRLHVLKKFAPYVRRCFRALGGEELSLRYVSSIEISGDDPGELSATLYHNLQKQREDDLRYHRTGIGPHRDDLAFYLNGKDARVYASQGQQRSIVLALKWGQVDLWQDHTGETPVVLLDDVMSELDYQRRNRLMETLRERAQIFLTAGELEESAKKMGGKVFLVHQGTIREEG